MKHRLDGLAPVEIANSLGIGVKAVYQREYRGRLRLSPTQRARYVAALKRNTGRRHRIRPMSLTFLAER